MDDSAIETIVQDFLQNLEQSQIEIPEDMVREMIVLSRKKQFDPMQITCFRIEADSRKVQRQIEGVMK